MTQQILTAILHKEDDLYLAECPEVGTVGQGYTGRGSRCQSERGD